MDKYDTSQLTEFPRFEVESTQSGVSTFFNKLWKFPLFSPNDPGDNGQGGSQSDRQQQNVSSVTNSKQDYDEKPDTGSYAVEIEARSLPNVLKRISSLVALGSGVSQYCSVYKLQIFKVMIVTIIKKCDNYNEYHYLIIVLLFTLMVLNYI